jgi:hypothetical protein
VTAGQTYVYRVYANCNKNHRQSITWKNSGGSTIGSAVYGASTAFSGSATFPNEMFFFARAPVGAVTAEFGVETSAADGVLNDYLWVDNAAVWTSPQYSMTDNDGVFVYANQYIGVSDASAYLSSGYAGIQGNFYINTAVHNDSAGHTMWELTSPDNTQSYTLRVNTSNTLELLFKYFDPIGKTFQTLSATGPTVTSMGTAWRSLYVVIADDSATLYNASSGTSYSINNTSPVPLSVGSNWSMTIGNTIALDSPWNSKLKFINLRAQAETALTFTDAIGDYTLKLSKNASAPMGSTSVSQAGFISYRIPLADGTIAGSRISYGPQTTNSLTTTPGVLGPNVLVRTSTDGTSWSSRVTDLSVIASYGAGVTTNNSSLWVRIDLQSDISHRYPVSLNRLKVDLWETLSVKGNHNGLVLTPMGTNPGWGNKDLHPSRLYRDNGLVTNSTSGIYMGSQSIASIASIDASGTIAAANKAYRTVAMMFRIDGVATNDYLFYHDEAGTIYSVYFNGSTYLYTGFSNVYLYNSNQQSGTMSGGGYAIPQWSWTYMVMVAPANMIPLSGDLTRFNFMTRSQANIANSIGGALKFVAMYPNALTLNDANASYDILRSIHPISIQDSASAVVSEPVAPTALTGDWGFQVLTAQEPTDSAS